MPNDTITLNADGRRLLGYVGSLVIVGALCFGWGRCTCPHETKAVVGASTIDVQIDSVPYPVPVPQLVYKYIKAKVTPLVAENATTDTATVKDPLTVRPICPDYVAEADSINDSVRLRVQYYTAEQRFAMDIQWVKPIVAIVPLTTIKTKETVYEKREWWMDALTHLGAATIGYGIGSIK